MERSVGNVKCHVDAWDFVIKTGDGVVLEILGSTIMSPTLQSEQYSEGFRWMQGDC